MINATTINKLNEMRLTAMAESYRHQLQESSFEALSFEERFSLMVDTEWARRKNSRLTKLIRRAEFLQSDACVENIEYHADRNWIKRRLPDWLPAATFKRNTTLLSWVLQEPAKPIFPVLTSSLPAGTSTRLNISACQIY